MNIINEERMKSAFPNEPVPKQLQENMLQREKAVAMGRRAEEMLTGKVPPAAASQDGLMAQAMVGRMALVTNLPKGASPEKMAQTLEKTDGFRAYRKQSMEAQLRGLSNGTFMKSLAPQKAAARSHEVPGKTAAPQEKGRML